MSFLYFLEGLRNPVLDALFSVITLFGEETIFMVIGMVFFWCIDKYQGYYLLSTGFVGTMINQFLKMCFRIPRPWVKDPNFTIVESAREAATGYSFPSGHTQTSVGLLGGIARANKHKVLRGVCIALCVLVPLSRMYLGVHTPADVGVSIVIATILIFALYPLFMKAKDSPKLMYAILLTMTAVMGAYLLFINLYRFPESVYHVENVQNLISARKNGFTLFGCALGFIVVYTVDLKWTHFDTKAVWWAQLIKAGGGLLVVLLVKEGLKAPLNLIFDENSVARCLRYFLMVVAGGALWPMTFKWFSKLGQTKE